MATRTDEQDDVAVAHPTSASGSSGRTWVRPLRVTLGTALAVVFALSCWRRGIPLDQVQIFAWLWAAALCWGVGRSVRIQVGFLRDWIPVLAVLVAYDYSAGIADLLGMPLHVTAMIDVDRALFGGILPTHWLQHHLSGPGQVHWYDAAFAIVYFSHFVTCLAIAGVLWFRNRARWAAFLRRFLAVSVLGVVGYILFPAAPPWWAAAHGYLTSVPRLTTQGWQLLDVPLAGAVISHGQARSNLLAAVPSLHAAFSLLAVAFFLPRVRRRWWPLLLAYPAAMGFGLVYFGEHYVTDILLGWSLVGVVCFAMTRAERWWSRRHVGGAQPGPAESSPHSDGGAGGDSGSGDGDDGDDGGDGAGGGEPCRPGWRRPRVLVPAAVVVLTVLGNVLLVRSAGAREPYDILVEAPSSAIAGGACSAVVYAMLDDTPDALDYGYPRGVDDRHLAAVYGPHSPEVRAFAELQPQFIARLNARPPTARGQASLTLLRAMRPEVVSACRAQGAS